MEAALKRTWDITGLALLGAGLGVLMQGSHELVKNISINFGKQTSLSCNLTEITLAALTIALLFASAGMGLKHVAAQHRGPKPISSTPWHLRDFELIGASLGLVPVLGHEAFELISGRWELATMTDPFFHIVSEIFMCGIGGELLFRAVARLRNWA
jgi:hypothetical protein